MERDEGLRLFKQRAEAVETRVTCVTSLQQALLYAVEITKNQGGSMIAAPALGPEERFQLEALCSQAGLTLVVENIRNHIGSIQTGLTLGDWGVAETATLVLDSTSEDVRIATMLSEIHVAILPSSRIKSDLSELESELSDSMESAPGYLSFISGASRTADIERVLTIGVHGPQQLHILILEEKQRGEES